MIHRRAEIAVATSGRGTYDITRAVQKAITVHEGLATVFCQHTSASLIICENADPDVRRDLEAFLARLVPDGDALFVHTAEGDDDMPAHVRTALTQSSIGIPVVDGRLGLGTWQGLFLYEHRRAPHQRRIAITCLGE